MNPSKVGIAGLLVIVTLLSMTIPTYAAAVTITPSSGDTFIVNGLDDRNFGGDGSVNVEAGGPMDIERILVKFDLSSIPAGSTINIAYLQLYYYEWNLQTSDPVGRTYTAYRVTTNWVEGSGVTPGGVCPGVLGATWEKPNDNPACSLPLWTTPGGDFTTSGAFANTVPAAFGYMTWTVTDIVKAWIEGGQPNYGFLIRDSNGEHGAGTYAMALFYSKEAGPTAQLPILKIDYTLTAIPEYPIGLPLLAIFMIISYGLIRRRTSTKKF